MQTVIIDCGSGNLHSAIKAFEKISIEVGGGRVCVSSDPEVISCADRLVLPGDGAFGACRHALFSCAGMLEALEDAVIRKGRPFMGICVGMQLMATQGLEMGTTPGLDWIAGEVTPIVPQDKNLKVPHMGWNDINILAEHPVLEGIKTGDHVYFVHSYAMQPARQDTCLATADYSVPITAIIGRANMIGTQFHPEKSQNTGLRMIANFLKWTP